MLYPLCEWKYTVREVSRECEWALLRSGRTHLPCCVMDPAGYLHKVWKVMSFAPLELHFNDG